MGPRLRGDDRPTIYPLSCHSELARNCHCTPQIESGRVFSCRTRHGPGGLPRVYVLIHERNAPRAVTKSCAKRRRPLLLVDASVCGVHECRAPKAATQLCTKRRRPLLSPQTGSIHSRSVRTASSLRSQGSGGMAGTSWQVCPIPHKKGRP